MRLLALLSAAVPAAAQSMPKTLQKIIGMLNDLEDTLEKEKQVDAEKNKKLECWCDHNNYGVPLTTVQENIKTAIEDARVAIETHTASKSRFEVEIAQQTADLEKNNAEKSDVQTAFASEMEKLEQSIRDLTTNTVQLKNALVVLNGGTGLSQKKVVLKLRSDLSNHLTSDKLQRIDQVLDEDAVGEKFLQTSSEQAPQSGEIIGILKQMLDEFTADLAETKKSKTDTKETHEKQIKNLNLKIETLDRQILRSKNGLAEASTGLSENKDALKENEALMGDLIKFHGHVQTTCKEQMEAYAEKVAARAEEIAVVRDVIEFFGNDENQQAFRATTNFLQIRNQPSSTKKATKVKATKVALAQAKAKQPGPFETVIKSMQDMIVNLKAEDEQDTVHKDECVENLRQNREEATDLADEMNLASAEIQKLQAELDGINKDKKDADTEIAQLNDDLNKLDETRAADKASYEKEHGEQSLALKLLKAAITKLQKVYPMFVQQPSEPFAADSFTTGPKGPNSAGSTIVQLFHTVIDDTAKTIKAIEKEETEAKENYTKEREDAIATKDTLQAKLVDIEGAKSSRETKLLNSNERLANLQTATETNQKTGQTYHQSCDFLIANYDKRRDSRRDEIQAVGEAIKILESISI